MNPLIKPDPDDSGGRLNINKFVNNQEKTDWKRSTPIKTYSKLSLSSSSKSTNSLDSTNSEGKSRYGRCHKPRLTNDFLSATTIKSEPESPGVHINSSINSILFNNALSIKNSTPKGTLKKRPRGRPRKITLSPSNGLSHFKTEVEIDLEAPPPDSTQTLPIPLALQDLKLEIIEEMSTLDNIQSDELVVGDLSWGSVPGFPYWPCVITRDPLTNLFVKSLRKGRCTVSKDMYHVRFFGDNGRRSWIDKDCIMRYRGIDHFMALQEANSNPIYKKTNLKLFKTFFIPNKMKKSWLAAVSEAESLSEAQRSERISYFCRIYPTPVFKPGPESGSVGSPAPKKRGRKRKLIEGTPSSNPSKMPKLDVPESESAIEPAQSDIENQPPGTSPDGVSNLDLKAAQRKSKVSVKKRNSVIDQQKNVSKKTKVKDETPKQKGMVKIPTKKRSGKQGEKEKLPQDEEIIKLEVVSPQKEQTLPVKERVSLRRKEVATKQPEIKQEKMSPAKTDEKPLTKRRVSARRVVPEISPNTVKEPKRFRSRSIPAPLNPEVATKETRTRAHTSTELSSSLPPPALPSSTAKSLPKRIPIPRNPFKSPERPVKEEKPKSASKQPSSSCKAKVAEELDECGSDSKGSEEGGDSRSESPQLGSSAPIAKRTVCALFGGVKSERVCGVCFKGGKDVLRCHGPCSMSFHPTCDNSPRFQWAAEPKVKKKGKKSRKLNSTQTLPSKSKGESSKEAVVQANSVESIDAVQVEPTANGVKDNAEESSLMDTDAFPIVSEIVNEIVLSMPELTRELPCGSKTEAVENNAVPSENSPNETIIKEEDLTDGPEASLKAPEKNVSDTVLITDEVDATAPDKTVSSDEKIESNETPVAEDKDSGVHVEGCNQEVERTQENICESPDADKENSLQVTKQDTNVNGLVEDKGETDDGKDRKLVDDIELQSENIKLKFLANPEKTTVKTGLSVGDQNKESSIEIPLAEGENHSQTHNNENDKVLKIPDPSEQIPNGLPSDEPPSLEPQVPQPPSQEEELLKTDPGQQMEENSVDRDSDGKPESDKMSVESSESSSSSHDQMNSKKPSDEDGDKGKAKGWMCSQCTEGLIGPCFLCGSDDGERMRCSTSKCGKVYHAKCTETWPQCTFKKSSKDKMIFNCPSHACHTCISDNPSSVSERYRKERLVRCVKCPTCYHYGNYCIPAGSAILSTSQILCPRHFVAMNSRKSTSHVNASWCFLCSIGGSLICCDLCPHSFHAECLKIKPPEGAFICEDCETGRYPLYGEIVWVKFGIYRWWPARILFPFEVPKNIGGLVHVPGEFAVEFFGTHDYYWLNRGRVFLFHDGDGVQQITNSKKGGPDSSYIRGVIEATEAFTKLLKEKASRAASSRPSLKPPKYVKIASNKPYGSVRSLEGDVASITACECDPESKNPCGPDSDCINRLLMVECNPDVCPAGVKCCNQNFEKRLYPPLTPFRTENRGWGLKTLVPLNKGDFVIEYVGEMIDEAEYKRRIANMQRSKNENYYFLTIDKDRMLDAGPKGNMARFMNHSCDPNCETQKWTVNGDTRVGLFTLKALPADSELVFNYNLETTGNDKIECKCEAENCAGYIGGKPGKRPLPLPAVEKEEKKIKMTKANSKKKKSQRSSSSKAAKNSFVPTSASSVIENEDVCFTCGEGGHLLLCDLCPKAYHLQCLGLSKQPSGGWVCPWHHCSVCTSSLKVIRCSRCINSYCADHQEGNIALNGQAWLCLSHNVSDSGSELSGVGEKLVLEGDEKTTKANASNRSTRSLPPPLVHPPKRRATHPNRSTPLVNGNGP